MKQSFPEVRVSGGFWIRCSLLLLLIPLPWACGAAAAAAFHELCHILCIYGEGKTVSGICLGMGGAQIRLPDLSRKQELLAAAAGPAGSFLLLLLVRIAPRTAICGLLQGLYNLLPVWPLDGGRVLSCTLVLLLGEERGQILTDRISRITLGLLAGLLLVISLQNRQNFLFLLLFLTILGKMKKIPCNGRLSALQ